jgi:hypothetical protein
MLDNDFDLKHFVLDPGRIVAFPKPALVRSKKWRRQFVRVPWLWVEQLQQARRVSTYRLAMMLLYEHWRTGGHPIALSNIGAWKEGLTRRSKWNALVELERLKLIRIERRARRAPRVKVLFATAL